ncbi:MAG: hypothetical protein WBC71_07945 [Salaquimonas sp.]
MRLSQEFQEQKTTLSTSTTPEINLRTANWLNISSICILIIAQMVAVAAAGDRAVITLLNLPNWAGFGLATLTFVPVLYLAWLVINKSIASEREFVATIVE